LGQSLASVRRAHAYGKLCPRVCGRIHQQQDQGV